MSNKFALSDVKSYATVQFQISGFFGGVMSPEHEKSISAPTDTSKITQHDETAQEKIDPIALPAHVAGSGTLDRLVDTARSYARAAASESTLKA
jgi:hypothetical protein